MGTDLLVEPLVDAGGTAGFSCHLTLSCLYMNYFYLTKTIVMF